MTIKKTRWIRASRGAVAHQVCFDCRVSFKDISICPHCHQPLINAGTRFKPPRRNNVRDWKRLYLTYLARTPYAFGWNSTLTVRDARKRLEKAWENNPIDQWRNDAS